MTMLRTRTWAALAVALAVFALAAPARATIVTYSTVGTFDSGDAAGTNTYAVAANGVSITFNGIITQSVDASPTSAASLGSFDSSATTATTLMPVTTGFTLDVFQTAPSAGGPAEFIGALTGSIKIDSSGVTLTFSGPLSQSIGIVTYTIGSGGVLAIVPPSTNGGVSTLQGTVSVAAVPEPATIVTAALAIPALVLLRRRRTQA